LVWFGKIDSGLLLHLTESELNPDEIELEENEAFRVFDMGRWKEAKLCLVCKRQFTWRKKWERCWGEVNTCSERCRQERKKDRRDTKCHEDHNTKDISCHEDHDKRDNKCNDEDHNTRDTKCHEDHYTRNTKCHEDHYTRDTKCHEDHDKRYTECTENHDTRDNKCREDHDTRYTECNDNQDTRDTKCQVAKITKKERRAASWKI